MNKADFIFVYSTASSREEAHALSRAVVERQLAACANIYEHHSCYRWRGKIEEGGEWTMIFKTRRALQEQLCSYLTDNHSYDCPCVIALPIAWGHAPYLSWLEKETSFIDE